jgi:hypothetical protein
MSHHVVFEYIVKLLFEKNYLEGEGEGVFTVLKTFFSK